jgi:hypothetical protein
MRIFLLDEGFKEIRTLQGFYLIQKRVKRRWHPYSSLVSDEEEGETYYYGYANYRSAREMVKTLTQQHRESSTKCQLRIKCFRPGESLISRR